MPGADEHEMFFGMCAQCVEIEKEQFPVEDAEERRQKLLVQFSEKLEQLADSIEKLLESARRRMVDNEDQKDTNVESML